MEDNKCLYCNDTGRTKNNPLKCEHCGKEYQKVLQINALNKMILEESYIPRKFRNSRWDRSKHILELTRNTKVDVGYMNLINEYLDVLNAILNPENRNLLFEENQNILIRHKNYDNEMGRFAYSFMVDIERTNRKVWGIIDINNIDLDSEEDKVAIQTRDLAIFRLTPYKIELSKEKLSYIIPERKGRDKITVILTTLPFNVVTGSLIEVSTMNKALVQTTYVYDIALEPKFKDIGGK